MFKAEVAIVASFERNTAKIFCAVLIYTSIQKLTIFVVETGLTSAAFTGLAGFVAGSVESAFVIADIGIGNYYRVRTVIPVHSH